MSESYRQFPPEPGGHHGGGAPSSAKEVTGVTNAVYVQNSPTIRIIILSARFMGISPCAGPLGAETLNGDELYLGVSSYPCNASM